MTIILSAILVLGVVAVVFGLILALAAKIFEVKTDPRLPELQSALAGANCGGCGYPGCAGCAEAILAGKAPVNACAPAGAEGAAKIAAIMGVDVGAGEKMVAHVICNGGDNCVKRYDYIGAPSCLAATKVAAGPTACQYGCLGFGECVSACRHRCPGSICRYEWSRKPRSRQERGRYFRRYGFLQGGNPWRERGACRCGSALMREEGRHHEFGKTVQGRTDYQ